MSEKFMNTDQKKIVVLGPIPYNTITTWKNESFDRYGGITYPVIALSKLMGEAVPYTHIVPVTHMRKKDEQTVKALLKGHIGVDLQHINSDLDQGDVIRTRVVDEHKVLEKQYGFMNPIIPRDVRDLMGSDMFVFVPLTDYDVSLETLEFIKTYNKDAIVIFDAHGPTTTMTSLGDRILKFWVDRDLWLPHIDILVMNLEEARCTWFAKEYTMEELESGRELDENELEELAHYCFGFGVKALYVTLGGDGCLVYYMKDGNAHSEKVHAVPLKNIIATAGCGESFIGGLAFGIATTNNYVTAARYGNVIGAQRCAALTYDVFKSLSETKKMVKENYGE